MIVEKGLGSVRKIDGNRKNPWQVLWKGKSLCYCRTRAEGLTLLLEMEEAQNMNNKTLEQVYDDYMEHAKISESKSKAMKMSFMYCQDLKDRTYRSIKTTEMQKTIDRCGKGYATQSHIRQFWKSLDKYAYNDEIIERINSQFLEVESVPTSKRTAFTESELELVKTLPEKVPYGDIAVIFFYTGFRISELCEMKKENIDFENMTFKGGVKTRAGKDRIVPIHPYIQDMVKKRYNESKTDRFLNLSAGQFRRCWNDYMGILGIKNKTVHEARHTFETMLDNLGANRKCIDMLMGHQSPDVGNKIYNHKTVDQLRETVNLIP